MLTLDMMDDDKKCREQYSNGEPKEKLSIPQHYSKWSVLKQLTSSNKYVWALKNYSIMGRKLFVKALHYYIFIKSSLSLTIPSWGTSKHKIMWYVYCVLKIMCHIDNMFRDEELFQSSPRFSNCPVVLWFQYSPLMCSRNTCITSWVVCMIIIMKIGIFQRPILISHL